MAYISAKEYSIRQGKSYKLVRNKCGEGRIKGARFFGFGKHGIWMIPENAEYPLKRKGVRS